MTGLSGRIEGQRHIFPVRVYYEDTDAAGVVYHAGYLRFAERARTEMLRLAGINLARMQDDHGLVFAVRDCAVDYLAPARLDDLVEVCSRLVKLAGASLKAEQIIVRDGSELARLGVRVACVDSGGRPARIPAGLREALEPYFERHELR
jgi:acyl-CoA thioester hydrolase